VSRPATRAAQAVRDDPCLSRRYTVGTCGDQSLGFRALPPLDRTIEVAASFADDLEAEEKQRLMRSANGTILVRLRTKALPFLDLMPDPRERFNQLPADRIKDLNGLILEKIELA
jgi:hypothetical protein